MKELLKKIHEIHFRWNIGRYNSKEKDKLTSELIDNYADEKFKNLNLDFVSVPKGTVCLKCEKRPILEPIPYCRECMIEHNKQTAR